jgi:hypothetical protein
MSGIAYADREQHACGVAVGMGSLVALGHVSPMHISWHVSIMRAVLRDSEHALCCMRVPEVRSCCQLSGHAR